MIPLINVCKLFRSKGVEFVIAGAHACALHGYIRATEDIDILIRNEKTNIQKTIECIEELYPHLEPITEEDLIENIVIKILDEPELDIMLSAWSLTYQDAKDDIETKEIEGEKIPFLGLKSLIQSKQTAREQDKWDVQILKELFHKKK